MKALLTCVFLLCAGVANAEELSHPSGCPRTAFCGCGAAVYLFGKPIRELWLAAAWRKFPAAVAARNMVAVWHHHVAVILQAYPDGTALMYDANSGGHKTRIHRRSLAGASIRDPHGSVIARVERPSKRVHRSGRVPVYVSSPSVPLLHTPV